MAKRDISIEQIERLTLENIYLKEQILQRDKHELNYRKKQVLNSILEKYGIAPSAQYKIEGTVLTVFD